ncbi:hypothetical protein [Streptomyces sp. NPDC008092]|uniref:hypothetical protein n=1 Tax=Streptomyces sp. NPDC008092 TaxID=3364808 RepID=UPI0036E31CD1
MNDIEERLRKALHDYPGTAEDVLEILRPDWAERDAMVRYWQTCRDGYATENRKLIGERNRLRREIQESSDLTAQEARAEVDRLSADLYYALDAVGYVEEMCTIVESAEMEPSQGAMVSTVDVRQWVKGPQCVRMAVVDASMVPATRPKDDAELLTTALRVQVRAALEKSGRSQASVARELQVSARHLNQMLVGHTKLTLWWAARILRCCGMRLVIGEVEG